MLRRSGLRKITLHTRGGLSSAFTPGWSPDGTSIVFSLLFPDAGRSDIYTASTDGRDLVKVTDTPDFEDLADWGTSSG